MTPRIASIAPVCDAHEMVAIDTSGLHRSDGQKADALVVLRGN